MSDYEISKQLKFERREYYRDGDFRVYLEMIYDQLFVHVVLNSVTKSVIRRVKEVWAEVVLDAYFQGFEEIFAYTKDNRIIKMIGNAERIGSSEDYEVFKWDLR